MNIHPILTGKVAVIADDEELLREIIIDELEDYDVKCLEAENGKKALELILENPVDFLLSDVRMPGGSGIDLLRDLKERKIFLDKPILMMSGFTDLSLEQAQGLGALTIVGKPFKMSDIIPLIADSLSRKRAS